MFVELLPAALRAAQTCRYLMNTFIRQAGRSTQKINDKQYTKYKKRKEKKQAITQ